MRGAEGNSILKEGHRRCCRCAKGFPKDELYKSTHRFPVSDMELTLLWCIACKTLNQEKFDEAIAKGPKRSSVDSYDMVVLS
jgi:hypothetical protein